MVVSVSVVPASVHSSNTEVSVLSCVIIPTSGGVDNNNRKSQMWKFSCSNSLCRNIFVEWDYPWNSFMADDLWPLMQKKVRLSQSMKGLTALKATTFIKRFGMQLLANYLRAIKNWGTYTYNVTVKKNENYRTPTEKGHGAFAPCRYLRRAIPQNNRLESNSVFKDQALLMCIT